MVTRHDLLISVTYHQIKGNIEILILSFRVYLFPIEHLSESIIKHSIWILKCSKLQTRPHHIRYILWVNVNFGAYISDILNIITYFGNT